MTRTKKALIFVLSAICILCVSMFVLAACGSKKPSSLSLNTKDVKKSYVLGEQLDLTGLTVTAVYDGKDDVVLKEGEYTVSPANGTTLTQDTTVTVAYAKDDSINAEFKVRVHNDVVSLTIETAPTKTEYWSGEEAFDKTGMVIKATLENGDVETVDLSQLQVSEDILVNGGDTTTEDAKQDITITYGGKTATQKVTVKANPVTEVIENEEKSSPRRYYASGESFNPAGVVLTLTYKSGTKKDVSLNNMTEGVDYDRTALIGDAGRVFDVDVTYNNALAPITVKVRVYIASGIYIEAESGLVHTVTDGVIGTGRAPTTSAQVSGNYEYRTDAQEQSGASVPWNDNYYATGGAYLGELREKAVSFIFTADKAGKASVAFRVASQYLKEDKDWTPVWMGDVQFNKVAKVFVNGKEYPIPDEVIMPGGGEQGGTPNPYLWFNWVEVALNDIDLVQGENDIMIQFLNHGINDCSQSSFNNNFCANVDSLKVISGECKVSKINDINSISVNSAEVIENEESASGYGIKITGKIDYQNTGLTEADALEILESDLKLNIGTNIEIEVTLDGSDFVATGDLPAALLTKKVKEVSVRFGLNNLESLKVAVIENTFLEESVFSWLLTNNDNSIVVIRTAVDPDAAFELTSSNLAVNTTNVKVEVIEGKVLLVVGGGTLAYTFDKYTAEEAKELAADEIKDLYHLDVQCTGTPNYNTYFSGQHFVIVDDTDTENKTFEVALDITSLSAATYGSHFWLVADKTAVNNDGNFVPTADIEAQSVTEGYFKYTLSFKASGEGASTWGCLNITVEDIRTVEYKATGVELIEEEGNVYLQISGDVAWTLCSEEDIVEFLNAKIGTGDGSLDFQGPLPGNNGRVVYNAADRVVAVTDIAAVEEGDNDYSAKFTVKINLMAKMSTSGSYAIHFGGGNLDFLTQAEKDEEKPDTLTNEYIAKFDVSMVDTAEIKVGHYTYKLAYEPWYSSSTKFGSAQNDRAKHYYGAVGLEVVFDASLSTTGVGANIAVEDDKVVYIVNGTYTSKNYTEEEIKDLIGKIAIDFQGNPHMQTYLTGGGTGNWDGNWDTHSLVNNLISVTLDSKTEGEGDEAVTTYTYTVKYDITSLGSSNYCYTGHYFYSTGLSNGDFKPNTDSFSHKVVHNGKQFEITYTKGGGNEAFYGCVGLRVTNAPVETPETPAE